LKEIKLKKPLTFSQARKNKIQRIWMKTMTIQVVMALIRMRMKMILIDCGVSVESLITTVS
jgi:hypothetical protein